VKLLQIINVLSDVNTSPTSTRANYFTKAEQMSTVKVKETDKTIHVSTHHAMSDGEVAVPTSEAM
jgi:hypothetical protein